MPFGVARENFLQREATLVKDCEYGHEVLMLVHAFSWRLASCVRFSIAVGPEGSLYTVRSGAHAAGIEGGFPTPQDSVPGIWVPQPLAFPREEKQKKWLQKITWSVGVSV